MNRSLCADFRDVDTAAAHPLVSRVAESVRHHRKLCHLSLDELAERSGVSRSALSQIESARGNPKLISLWKIASSLNMPLQDLFRAQPPGASVVRAHDHPPLRNAHARMESRLLSPAGGAPGIQLYDVRLPARACYWSDPHEPGTTATLLVQSGGLRVIAGEDSFELHAGDSLFFRVDIRHAYQNHTLRPTRCISVFSSRSRGPASSFAPAASVCL